jgi:hypothetical protein
VGKKLYLCIHKKMNLSIGWQLLLTMTHRFTAQIIQNEGMDAAYVVVPVDIRACYGVGRLKVEAIFDGEHYSGSVVNMGVRDGEGNICYIIGITKAIRKKIGKSFGDWVEVELTPIILKKNAQRHSETDAKRLK